MNRALVLAPVAALALAAALVAGPLNPPAGPVASSFKTLTEVEPRIAVSAANTPGDATCVFRISQPGSYYLTGNVAGVSAKHGIKIDAADVTLDLNGFSLIGPGVGSLDGINMPALRSAVVIRNGTVQGWGGSGVNAAINTGRIETIVAASNAVWGIDNATSATASTHIVDCEAFSNTFGGIRAGAVSLVTGCVARLNDGEGISVGVTSQVTGCTARGNLGNGISTSAGGVSMISECTVGNNSLDGILAQGGSSVLNCVASGNSGDGIEVNLDCLVRGNICSVNGLGASDGAGIHATSGNNRIDTNNVTGNDRGIDIDGAGNLVVANSAAGNTTDYVIAASNRYGPIVNITTTGSAAVSGNSAVSTLSSTDPWANFAY